MKLTTETVTSKMFTVFLLSEQQEKKLCMNKRLLQ